MMKDDSMEEPDYRAIVHYKTYPRFERIELKNALPRTPFQDLLKNRRTRRVPSGKKLNIDTLHPIIALATGRTGKPGSTDEDFRAYPSAGARYPLELYLVVFEVNGLEKGIYHFSPMDNSLEVLWPGDYKEMIDEMLNNALDGFHDHAKLFLIMTSMPDRTTFKYGEEGGIFPYIEAGYLGANLTLLLEEEGFNPVAIGVQWCADELGELLDVNVMKERVVSGMAVL